MASVSDDPNGRKRILFIGADGKRRPIRLGKISAKQADAVKLRVERLVASQVTGHPPDDETSRWLQTIDGDLRAKLERAGLVAGENRAHATLRTLCDEFFAAAEVKPGTATTYRQAERSLVEFFGADKRIRDISAEDAAKWRQSMRAEGLAAATISKRVKTARQFFKFAVEWEWLDKNRFLKVKAGKQSNAARQFFVSRDDTQRILDKCPDAEWRAIVALSRYGGLRCPSEILLLRWQDVNWEAGRILVTSPKTEHHEGKANRLLPMFPELRAVLLDVFEQAADGAEHVVTRYRECNANLRTQFNRIIRRAGLVPWPRLFHNMRSTRQTELSNEFPAHVVCEWLGNSEKIAADHYLQTTDAHFEKAAAECGAAPGGNALQRLATADPGNAETPGFAERFNALRSLARP